MSTVRLDKKSKRVTINRFDVDSELMYTYFSRIPIKDRDTYMLKAISLGVLALMEDRFSSFLAKTSADLGVQLESLKMIFDMKQEVFYKTSVKGLLAENDIASFLSDYIDERGLSDEVEIVGMTPGALPNNRTGDIVCYLDCDRSRRIVVECKFSRNIRLGSVENADVESKLVDTVWSQLLESQVNREAAASIVVMDRTLLDASVSEAVDNVGYIKGVGFVAIIDSQANNYTNLAIAYMLARDIALRSRTWDVDGDVLSIVIQRVLKDIGEIQQIRSLIEANIENSKLALKRIEKSLLGIAFSRDYLEKFIADGTLSRSDILAFYEREGVRDKYRALAGEIEERFG